MNQIVSVPAPVGGLNALDSLASMPQTDAIVLTNAFPRPGYVELRKGYAQWATGLPGWVETIIVYSSNAAANSYQLFAMSGTALYNVTAGGAVGAAVVTGLSNARWEYTNMGTPGGSFLYAANGTNAPLLYDGATWRSVTGVSTPYAITGVTTSELRNPWVWKNRIWFVEHGSCRAWYLPLQSIAGAAASVELASQFTKGGVLQAIFTVSMSDGSSSDDYIAFMSSEGEILLYRGTDPSWASTFALSGKYQTGAPLGRRCVVKWGAETYLLTTDGLIPFSQIVLGNLAAKQQALTYKVSNLWAQNVGAAWPYFGWEAAVHPHGDKLIANYPTASAGQFMQLVMNLTTKAWCQYTGWQASTFAVAANVLLFGGNGFIAQADTGYSDNGAGIQMSIGLAFNRLGTDKIKHVQLIRTACVTSAPSWTFGSGVCVNYNTITTVSLSHGSASGAWMGAAGEGFAISAALAFVVNGYSFQFNSLDYNFTIGGDL